MREGDRDGERGGEGLMGLEVGTVLSRSVCVCVCVGREGEGE